MTQRRKSLPRNCTPLSTPASSGFNTIKVICAQNLVARLVLTSPLGLVGYGEQVKLVREPHNQYDRCVASTAYVCADLTSGSETRFEC